MSVLVNSSALLPNHFMDCKLNIVLHANQMKVHKNPARFNVIKAGKRWGKTKLALYRAIKKAAIWPNDTVWYIAPSYRHAKNIAWWELNWMLPREIVKRSVENELLKEFVNGTRLQLIGAENEDSLRGPALRHVVMDEASYIKENVWPAIISGQLMGRDKQTTADFISSPNDKGRNWFTDFHAEAKRKMESGDKDWAAYYFTIYDNPTLLPEEVQKIKDQNTEDRWNLEYMAIESSYAGKLYSEFNSDIHVGEFEIKPEWPVFRALDWGIAHPTVCLWLALDISNKMVYIFNEYVKSGQTIEENSNYIKRFTEKEPDWSVIDPSTAKRNSQTHLTDMDEFRRCGIACIPADNRNVGIDVLKMFFKRNMIKIHPKCKTLILQLKNLQVDDTENDDCCDCARYGVLRIHDSIRSMNVFNSETKPIIYNHNGESNFNDPILFPKKKYEGQTMSWINEELDFVA